MVKNKAIYQIIKKEKKINTHPALYRKPLTRCQETKRRIHGDFRLRFHLKNNETVVLK